MNISAVRQAHGGVVQGIGQAPWESVRYDESGQMLTGSFMDYALPRAGDAPSFGVVSRPAPAVTNWARTAVARRGARAVWRR